MSARLHSLGFTPRGPSGWTTPFLEYGRIVTLVHGPNGSGKTPILKGIAFALGYPIELPPDVSRQCESVVLTISDGGNPVRIERVICDDFDVRVSAAEGDARRFSDEKTFTSWVIGLLGIPERSLAGKMKGVVAPYVSTLVPMFWIDQDNAWIGCDSGDCRRCADTLERACADGSDIGPECYGGSITVASPGYSTDPLSRAAGVAGCSGADPCQDMHHATCGS